MALNISRAKDRTPPLRAILFGEVGMWKTSTAAHVPRALWLDLHGSTATLARQPDCAFDPLSAERPETFPEFIDMLRDVSRYRGEFDAIVTDGLDDIDRLYVRPEALRRSNCQALGDNYGKPYDHVVTLHNEVVAAYESLYHAGFNLIFTAHTQNVERVNAEGANFMVTDIDVTYQSGKVGKWDCPSIWRDWVDIVAYLTTEGRRVSAAKGEKIAKATGDLDQHVAYIRCESWLEAKGRRLDTLASPLPIASPEECWRALSSGWADSFASLDTLKAQARALGATKISADKLDKFHQSVDTETTVAGLRKILAHLQKQ